MYLHERFQTSTADDPRRPKTPYPRSRLQVSGLRYYSPGLGRWASRDPIQEIELFLFLQRDHGFLQATVVIYQYASNNGIDHWDILGLLVGQFHEEWIEKASIGNYKGDTAGFYLLDCHCKCKEGHYRMECDFDYYANAKISKKIPYKSKDWRDTQAHEAKHVNNLRDWYSTSGKWISSQESEEFSAFSLCEAWVTSMLATVKNSHEAYYEKEKKHQPPNWPPGNPWEKK